MKVLRLLDEWKIAGENYLVFSGSRTGVRLWTLESGAFNGMQNVLSLLSAFSS